MPVTINGTSGITTPGLDASGTNKFATTIGVGNATPSASGAGITFPATQSASSNANTLDDYEEGTWTPTLRGEATAGTPASGTGHYTKIGRFVYVSIRFENIARPSGASGNVFIDVPFTFDSSLSSYSIPGVGLLVLFSGSSIANTYQSVRVSEGTPYFRVQYQSNLNTDYTNLVVTDLGASSNYIRFTFGYFVA